MQQHLIWIIASIILNVIIFIGIKFIHKRYLNNNVLTLTTDEWGKYKDIYDKFWDMALIVNGLIWIIIIAILLLFNSYNGQSEQADVGTTILKKEIQETVPVEKEEINKINETTLKEKEVVREKEVQTEKQKSRDEFNEFLNNH